MAIHSSIFAEESYGQRSLAGYSLWGHKKKDTTEQLALSIFMYVYIYTHTHTHTHAHIHIYICTTFTKIINSQGVSNRHCIFL